MIEAGLKCLQRKGIIRSVSLKEGRRVPTPCSFGQELWRQLWLWLDETGQADTAPEKLKSQACCDRGFPVEHLKISSLIQMSCSCHGIEEHNNYAVDFYEATKWIKKVLPKYPGISNLSFSFRGNNAIREAMHSVFLFHAIQAGLDMGIVNAGQLAVYSEIWMMFVSG